MKAFILKAIMLATLLQCCNTITAQVATVKFTVHTPGITKNDKGVYLAGSFNYWHAADTLYRMKDLGNGVYTLTIPVFNTAAYEYKYCLGNWNKVETAANDSDITNRRFTASKRKHIDDTVIKWRLPKPAPDSSAQLKKFAAMKDSLANQLKPEIEALMSQLQQYAQNMLQAQPSIKEHERLDSTAVDKIGHIYRQITGLLWNICNSLSPEKRQRELKKLNDPSTKDFFNTFLEAINNEAK